MKINFGKESANRRYNKEKECWRVRAMEWETGFLGKESSGSLVFSLKCAYGLCSVLLKSLGLQTGKEYLKRG